MKIKVNHEYLEVEPGISIAGLLDMIKIKEKRGLAIAVNNEVVPKILWTDKLLEENDVVTVITATAGG